MLALKQINQDADISLSLDKSIKWTWSLRKLQREDYFIAPLDNNYFPQAGDIAVTEVIKVGNHSRMYSAENKYLRLYKGDIIMGSLGFRYATDAFHADKLDLDNLHLLTNSGLMGTVTSRHSKTSEPTKIKVIGILKNKQSQEQVNLKKLYFQPSQIKPGFPPVVFVVGTGMNSGKTTTTARIGKSLVNSGLSVCVLKVTGSVSNRDLFEFEAVGAKHTSDFSDYGFPSTYLSSQEEIESLYVRMVNDCIPIKPDIVLVEIADGILQRETQMLLKSETVKATSVGIVLTAPCALSAFSLVKFAEKLDHFPICVSGIITNSPLFTEEFHNLDKRTPLHDTQGEVGKIGSLIMERVNITTRKVANRA